MTQRTSRISPKQIQPLGVDIICEKGAGILHSIRASSFLLYLIPAQLVVEVIKFETVLTVGRKGSKESLQNSNMSKLCDFFV